jgi:hypothetical protein
LPCLFDQRPQLPPAALEDSLMRGLAPFSERSTHLHTAPRATASRNSIARSRTSGFRAIAELVDRSGRHRRLLESGPRLPDNPGIAVYST